MCSCCVVLVKASVLELYSVVVGGIASVFFGAGIFPGAGSERCLEAEEVILLLLPLLLSLVRLLLLLHLLLLGCLLRLLLLPRLGSCHWCSTRGGRQRSPPPPRRHHHTSWGCCYCCWCYRQSTKWCFWCTGWDL